MAKVIKFVSITSSQVVTSASSSIMFGGGQGEVFLGRDFAQTKDYSEETAGIIDEEVKRIIDTAYNRARQILTDHVDKLHAVAGVLLEKEKIEGEEFERIFSE